MKLLEGKVAVVTGAARGIGKAIALRFAEEGASVVFTDLKVDENFQNTEKELQALGVQAKGYASNAADFEDTAAVVAQIVKDFGRIDVLICNAGISMRALFDEVDLGVLKRLMDVNFWGTVYCTKYALPYIQASRGSIVGVSSVAGFHGLPGRTGYSASKYAMTGFLETVRIENLKKGVHVMIAAPGFTASNVRFSALTADGSAQGESPRKEEKMMSAAEVARRIARGVVRRKRTLAMDFNGRATVLIKKFAPGLLDRLYYSHMAKEPDSPLK